MKIQQRRAIGQALLALGGVLAVTLSAGACGPKGAFTPYTDGSQLAKGASEEASLVLAMQPPNGLFHQPRYDITIVPTNAKRPAIKLGFIMDGRFERPAQDLVRLTCSGRDGLSVTTSDVLLESLVDQVALSMQYLDSEQAYALELRLLDADNRVVGEFSQKLAREASTAAATESGTSAAAVFEWLLRNSATAQ